MIRVLDDLIFRVKVRTSLWTLWAIWPPEVDLVSLTPPQRRGQIIALLDCLDLLSSLISLESLLRTQYSRRRISRSEHNELVDHYRQIEDRLQDFSLYFQTLPKAARLAEVEQVQKKLSFYQVQYKKKRQSDDLDQVLILKRLLQYYQSVQREERGSQ